MKQTSSLRSPSRSLQRPASPRNSTSRQHGLQLTGLPRFHPANFQPSHSSTDSSADSTPSLGSNPPQLASPSMTQRQYSEAQRQLYLYQRELISLNRGGTTSSPFTTTPGGTSTSALRSSALPISPQLPPLGSPGPVTPLELDEREEYLAAGVSRQLARNLSEEAKNEIVEAYVQNELAATNNSLTAGTLRPGRRDHRTPSSQS